MIPTPLWRANLGYFRRHRWLLLSMWLGVALGTAAVAGVALSTYSADANFRLATERLQGRATHRLVAADTLDERWLVPLQQQLGVAAAPVIQRYLRVAGAERPLLQLLATDLLQAPTFRSPEQLPGGITLSPSAWLQQPGVMVGTPTLVQLGLAVGDWLPVETATGPKALPIIAALGTAEDIHFSRLALIDIGQAQALLGLAGQLDWIELRLTPAEAERVRAWLPAGLQLHALADASSESLAASLYLNLRALSLLAMVVGLFLVYNSLQFSLVQRQPLLARLRTLGVSVAELRRYFALELLLVALLGTLSGLWLGTLLAERLVAMLTTTVNNLYSISPLDSLQLTPAALLQSLGTGIGGTLLAGWWPLRRMLAAPPLVVAQRVATDRASQRAARRQLVIGLAMLPLIALLGSWQGSGLIGGLLAVTLWLLAVALLMPMLVRAVGGGLAPRLRRANRLLGAMALRDAGRALSRTGVALMALTIAVTVTVGMSVLVGSFRTTLELWLQQRLNADLYVAPLSRVPGDDTRLPRSLVEWVEAEPAVAALAHYRRRELHLGDGRRVELFGAVLPTVARAGYRFRAGEVAAIWAGFDAPDGVLISEPLANRLGLVIGDTLRLPTPVGEQQLRVAGVYYDYGYPQGRLLLSATNYRRLWDDRPPRVLGIYLRPGASAESLIHRLQQRPGAEQWRITATEGVMARSLAVFQQTFRITELLRGLALGVAFVGIFASLLALQLEREPELRLYHALGLSVAEQRWLLLWQVLFLGGLAGLVAMPAGVVLGWALGEWVQLRAFGWSLALSVPLSALWPAPLLALLAAALSALYPAWRLGRVRVLRGAE